MVMTGPDIRALRTRLGMSQHQFGAKVLAMNAHYTAPDVSKLELGKRLPTGEQAIRLWACQTENREVAAELIEILDDLRARQAAA